MHVSGMAGSPWAGYTIKTQGKAQSSVADIIGMHSAEANREPKQASAPARSEAAQKFIDYMDKTPAERLQEDWLKRHGLTKAEFDALPADEKQALVDQMRIELEAQLKEQAKHAKNGEWADLLV